MGLSNYSFSWTLKSSKPFEQVNDFKLFKDILNLSDVDECYIQISQELGCILHSENQFNKVFEPEYGKLSFSDFLNKDELKRLGSLHDAKPWFDSDELTVIDSMDDGFDVFENEKLLFFLRELKKYLDGFKWHTEKPKLYAKLDEINLLIIVGQFSLNNDLKIKMISA